MKKFVFLSIFVLFIACSFSFKTDNPLSISNLIAMNKKQIKGVKSISIEDEKGFKYLKNSIKIKVFKEVSYVKNSHEINQEDMDKINAVIKKYK